MFECVMNPYYLLPASAIILVLASRMEKIPLMVTAIVVAACTLLSYQFMSPWPYYASVTGTLLVAVALTRPRDRVASKVHVQV
jgi:cytochrome bd-type quinol oxidase subunit 1